MGILKFDSEAMFKDMIQKALIPAANDCMQHYYDDAMAGLGSEFNDQAKIIEPYLNKASTEITAGCVFYAGAILESFGMGSEMDKVNSEFEAYKSSYLWNPLRTGRQVVGRTKGFYINFFGVPAKSKGRLEGKKLKMIKKPPKKYKDGLNPINYADQQLTKGLREGGYVQRAVIARINEYFGDDPTNRFSDFFKFE